MYSLFLWGFSWAKGESFNASLDEHVEMLFTNFHNNLIDILK